MSYTVLARQWRPKNFQQVVGQQHIVRALSNALEQNRMHHAYLFTGTHGTGKTTLARVLAKCFNCEQGMSPTPCETCPTCEAINQGHCLDLLEIDAASRTSVEDMKDLISNVQYSPNQARYKIYIIDEVHMLSNHSFNALLKTLEEPPSHVIFILATTDPQKLPITILSRCLQFHLKNLTVDQISQQLQQILTAEEISFEPEALAHIAEAARGSMRDALSLLDQAIAYSEKNISLKDIQALLGISDQENIIKLLFQLQHNNGQGLLNTINELAENAADFSHILEQIIKTLHHVAMIQVVPECKKQFPGLDNTDFDNLVTNWTPEDTQVYYQIALMGQRDLPLSPTPRSGFEMVMLRMLAFRPVTSVPRPEDTIPSELSKIETRTTPPEKKKTIVIPELDSRQKLDASWLDIYPQLSLTGLTKTIAGYCVMKEKTEDTITLLIDPSQETILNAEQQKPLQQALQDFYNTPITLKVEPGIENQPSPVNIAKKIAAEKLQQANVTIEQDPQVKNIIEQFSATLEPDAIIAVD